MKKILKPILWVVSTLKRKWKLILGLLVILALIGLWQYQKYQSSKPKLTFVNPQYQDLVKKVDVSGVIDAKEKARLRFLAGGKVVYIGAKEGDSVKKGQTIATIDQATLQKQLDQYLNSYSKERLDWDQTLDNTKDRALPKSEERTKDKEQIDLETSVLTVEIQDIAIKNTRLNAPFAGILTTSPSSVVPGMQLLSTDVFEIVNPASLIFRAQIDETDLAKIKIGQPASLELDAYPDEKINTNVSYIAFAASAASSGTVYGVEFPINNPDLSYFRLGMNGDISIEVDRASNVMTIPYEATRQRDDGTFVDVRTGKDTYEARKIEVGLETEDFVEVKSGLSTSDEILLPQ